MSASSLPLLARPEKNSEPGAATAAGSCSSCSLDLVTMLPLAWSLLSSSVLMVSRYRGFTFLPVSHLRVWK